MTLATTNKTLGDNVRIVSRSGSGISKSGSIDYEVIFAMRTLDNNYEVTLVKSLGYSVSINVFNKKCVRNWNMRYYRQNKNKSWKKQSTYTTVDTKTIDSIIGSENRIAIENTINSELIAELQHGLNEITEATRTENA